VVCAWNDIGGDHAAGGLRHGHREVTGAATEALAWAWPSLWSAGEGGGLVKCPLPDHDDA
jgi:hypothetical protein